MPVSVQSPTERIPNPFRPPVSFKHYRRDDDLAEGEGYDPVELPRSLRRCINPVRRQDAGSLSWLTAVRVRHSRTNRGPVRLPGSPFPPPRHRGYDAGYERPRKAAGHFRSSRMLILLSVLYVLSYGPACCLASHPGNELPIPFADCAKIPTFYSPIGSAATRWKPARLAIVWYANAWIPTGRYVFVPFYSPEGNFGWGPLGGP